MPVSRRSGSIPQERRADPTVCCSVCSRGRWLQRQTKIGLDGFLALNVQRTIGRPYSVLLLVGFAVPPALPRAQCALAAPSDPCPERRRAVRAVCFLWHFPRRPSGPNEMRRRAGAVNGN